MTKVTRMKLASDMESLDQFQQACDRTNQYEDSIKKSLQPVYDALNSCPECHQTIDAYDALVRAEERLVMAYVVMGWAGEVGEVANKAKKVLRDGKPVDSIAKECRDASWYQNQVFTFLGVRASEMATGLINHLRDRQARGVIKGSGDNR